MTTPKVAAVTFWIEEPSRILVFNGFSFIAHAVPLAHCFVNPAKMSEAAYRDALRSALANFEQIYCSLTATEHLQAILPIVDGRWLFGGPAIISNKVPVGIKCYQGTMESLLGMPPSNTFTDYWTGHPWLPRKPVFFACSIGSGCYWNKCTFCDYHNYSHKFSKKKDIAKILLQLKNNHLTNNVHLCIAAFTPEILKEILSTGQQHKFTFVCFCRADRGLVKFVKEYKQSLYGLLFCLGVETLSSEGMAVLKKGFDFEMVFEMTQAIVEKGGRVEWSLMDNLPFLTTEMAEGYEKNCARASMLAKSYPLLTMHNNGPVLWPDSKIAGQHGAFRILPDGRAISVISPGMPSYTANLRADAAIMSSGIPLFGLQCGTVRG